MSSNPFVLKPEEYVRDINVMKHYVDDAVFFLSTSTGQSPEVCREFIKRQLRPGGKFEFKDPKVVYLQRGENGDREEREGTMAGFLGEAVNQRELIAPNFTTYQHPEVNQSVLVHFVDENVAGRSKAKKEMFKARMDGNEFLEALKSNEQSNKKIANNSISGGHVSSSTPLYNKTSHSTLTSNCRSTSGYGNANNEKLLCGNRHYWNAKVTLNNIVSIVNHTDYDVLEKAMTQFHMRHPTVEETMHCIERSARQYWRNDSSMEKIREFVARLSDIQRSAFVYTGDLYHLAQCNPEVVRHFILSLAKQVKEPCENPREVLKTYREEYRVLATMIFPTDMKGKQLSKEGDVTDELLQWVASTTKNIHTVIEEYAVFIKAFFVTTNVPASLAFFPESIRHAALTSDTDSTIFTVQDWVFWIFGEDAGFNDATYAVESVVVFIAAETITHILARMSANFGIETKRIHQVAMKNEFKFDVFIPTQVGKHYYAYISAQEGNIYKDFKKEIKGVHLKSSNVPRVIMKKAEDMMTSIMDTVVMGKKISLRKYLKEIADTEREIERSMLNGEDTYFRFGQVKSADSYKKSEEESPYQHYTFWTEVFADKYGAAPKPPYACYKVALNLKTAKMIQDWIDSVPDDDIRNRLKAWIEKNKKTTLQSLLLPADVIRMAGMPSELVPILDLRRAIYDNSSVFYILLESLGIYRSNDRLTTLIMDEF